MPHYLQMLKCEFPKNKDICLWNYSYNDQNQEIQQWYNYLIYEALSKFVNCSNYDLYSKKKKKFFFSFTLPSQDDIFH